MANLYVGAGKDTVVWTPSSPQAIDPVSALSLAGRSTILGHKYLVGFGKVLSLYRHSI